MRYLAALSSLIKQPRLNLGKVPTKPLISVLQTPTLELKQMPNYLRHAYLEEKNPFSVIISNSLTEKKKTNFLRLHSERKLVSNTVSVAFLELDK